MFGLAASTLLTATVNGLQVNWYSDHICANYKDSTYFSGVGIRKWFIISSTQILQFCAGFSIWMILDVGTAFAFLSLPLAASHWTFSSDGNEINGKPVSVGSALFVTRDGSCGIYGCDDPEGGCVPVKVGQCTSFPPGTYVSSKFDAHKFTKPFNKLVNTFI